MNMVQITEWTLVLFFIEELKKIVRMSWKKNQQYLASFNNKYTKT